MLGIVGDLLGFVVRAIVSLIGATPRDQADDSFPEHDCR